jgi:hypothetical protein
MTSPSFLASKQIFSPSFLILEFFKVFEILLFLLLILFCFKLLHIFAPSGAVREGSGWEGNPGIGAGYLDQRLFLMKNLFLIHHTDRSWFYFVRFYFAPEKLSRETNLLTRM